MSQISDFRNPWRNLLLSEQASFRGWMFHVDQGGRSSGRRVVNHEYPKRNENYAEDMGRSARRFQFSGYLVYMPAGQSAGPPGSVRYDYVSQRTRLYEALEDDDVGRLVHPVFCKNGMQVVCERYTMSESKDRGGFTQFDMQFVEAGSPTKAEGTVNTVANLVSSAVNLNASVLSLLNPIITRNF